MSERWSDCTSCTGSNCIVCGGTGCAGDAMDLTESQNRLEWQRDHQIGWSLRETSDRLQKMEDAFYKNSKTTPAIEAAILALEKHNRYDKPGAMENETSSGSVISFFSKRKKPMTQQLAVNDRQVVLSKTTAPAPYFPSESDWNMMLSWGSAAIKSGMLPEGIKSAEAAAIIALKGRELGIPFMIAIAHIHIIKGKPSMSAELMQTMARKNLPGLQITILESTIEKAVVQFLRPEAGSTAITITFSMEDAKRADLLGNPNNPSWRRYPKAMLWSRAISAGLRMICPEALMGVSYTPEELGANVDNEGNVIETTSREVKPVPPPEPKVNTAQLKRMFTIASTKNVSNEQMKDMIIKQLGHNTSKDLTISEYNEIVAKLESIPIEPTQEESDSDEFDSMPGGPLPIEDPRMVK